MQKIIILVILGSLWIFDQFLMIFFKLERAWQFENESRISKILAFRAPEIAIISGTFMVQNDPLHYDKP